MASERCRARVKQLRSDWFRQRMPAMREHPERIVFIDETSVKTNLTRLRGRALHGQRLIMDAPFGSWGTQTFIAGLTADALIAPWVIKGAMDGNAFAAYIREVLAPELSPRTVVILDNLATHRNAEATRAIRQAGCPSRAWRAGRRAIANTSPPSIISRTARQRTPWKSVCP